MAIARYWPGICTNQGRESARPGAAEVARVPPTEYTYVSLAALHPARSRLWSGAATRPNDRPDNLIPTSAVNRAWLEPGKIAACHLVQNVPRHPRWNRIPKGRLLHAAR